VGCGAITREAHLPSCLRSPWSDATALVDSRVENARALARSFGISPVIASDVDDVIDRVDGFVIATPNDTHHPIARRILDRGKPVLIEKPITTTYRDALDLCELAEAGGTFISVGYRYRFFSSARLLKSLLDDGYFGRVVSFHCEMGSRGGWAPISGYNLERKRSGGGVLMINGTHFLDLALYWFGVPASFRYQDDNYGNVEANCKGAWIFDGAGGRFEGTFFFSKTISLTNRFVITTEHARVEWNPADAERIKVLDPRRPGVSMELSARDAPRGGGDSFRDQIEEFCRNAVHPGPLTSDGRNAARSVKLIEDMYASSTRLAEGWLLYKSA
jgi:predicted dehydrogenase